MTSNGRAKIALSCGEPAGIGPDLIVQLAQESIDAEFIVFADESLLKARAAQLQLPLTLYPANQTHQRQVGELAIVPIPLQKPCYAQQLDVVNVPYVLQSLRQAAQACLSGVCDALVTPPLHKGIINTSGISFTGHTEFLAKQSGSSCVVMMLANPDLRVALATTHCPLAQVAKRLSTENLIQQLHVVISAMTEQFSIEQPRIAVCGLNPHAGEHGYLGTEEQSIIIPAIDALQKQGHAVLGPYSADTIFVPRHAKPFDVIFCQYHDQGLPVIKATGFGRTVNISLGLPFIRTSVDHGTALHLAGTLQACPESLIAATSQAIELSHVTQTA